jgi:signal transduction histidine kinase
MLWADPYILIALSAMGMGFIVISLLMSEHSSTPSFFILSFLQIVANTISLLVFILRYFDFVSHYYRLEGVVFSLMVLFPNHSSVSYGLLLSALVITVMVSLIYMSIRSTEKSTIGNLFYSNTTPIAIMSDIGVFDSNRAFQKILSVVSVSELRKSEKIAVADKVYLVKHYTNNALFKSSRDETLVLMDISEQELTLKQLDLLDQRLSMISMLLKNKLQLMERLIELKSKNSIAIQLHDEIGHNLTLSVSVLDRMRDANLRLQIPEHSIEQLLEEGKNIALSLSQDRKNAVSGKYLEEMLESYILYLRWVGIHVELNVDTQQIKLNQNSILTLYAICKEAFSNTVKYAYASEIQVLLRIGSTTEETMLELHIRDNGKGCPFVKESNGLKAIRARVERNHGIFEYEGTQGFRIHCYLPLQSMTEVVL